MLTKVTLLSFLALAPAARAQPPLAGAYDIESGAARGRGPRGQIDVRLTPVERGWEVTGQWNGGRVHLLVTAGAIQGTAVRPLASGEWTFCRYDLARTDDGYAGTTTCLGPASRRNVRVQPRLTTTRQVLQVVAYLTAP